jgi:hypothetical protein
MVELIEVENVSGVMGSHSSRDTKERQVHLSGRAALSHLERRKWPLLIAALTIIVGTTYPMILTVHVSSKISVWRTPGDLWETFRSAHYVGWGDVGYLYDDQTGLVSFPGMSLLLAPIAMLSQHFHMTEDLPFFLPRPSAWYLLGPYSIALSTSFLFAADALAEYLGVPSRRRVILAVLEAAALSSIIIWGHPEDALGSALLVYAFISGMKGKWTACGWTLGAAILVQPLVLTAVPLLLAICGAKQVFGLLCRGMLPTVVAMLGPLKEFPGTTIKTILEQPNFPLVDHVTPLTATAPSLGGVGTAYAVAAGPGRMISIVLAIGISIYAARWRDRAELLMAAVALIFLLRPLTESVMVAYYVFPAMAVGLIVAAKVGWKVTLSAGILVLGTVVSIEMHYRHWLEWWILAIGGTTTAVVLPIPFLFHFELKNVRRSSENNTDTRPSNDTESDVLTGSSFRIESV